MRKIITGLILSFLMLGCTPKLSQSFYRNSSDILFQQKASYMPNGYNKTTLRANYPGILAVVKNELIFDTRGIGSVPGMTFLNPLRFDKKTIVQIEISHPDFSSKKLITIKTIYKKYYFYSENSDHIFQLLTNWQSNKKN